MHEALVFAAFISLKEGDFVARFVFDIGFPRLEYISNRFGILSKCETDPRVARNIIDERNKVAEIGLNRWDQAWQRAEPVRAWGQLG